MSMVMVMVYELRTQWTRPELATSSYMILRIMNILINLIQSLRALDMSHLALVDISTL